MQNLLQRIIWGKQIQILVVPANSVHGNLCGSMLVKFSDIDVEEHSLLRVKVLYKFKQFCSIAPLVVPTEKLDCVIHKVHACFVHLVSLHVVKSLFLITNVRQTM